MSTGLATANGHDKPRTIKERLQSPEFIAALGETMPTHCKPERMARIAITALTRTPKLAQCDQASFFRCLLDLSQWGLEPDGRRAHLIPFDNRKRGVTECQLIIDYKGYVELAYRSGVVRNIHADVVREGDVFDYSTGRIVKHVPHFLRRDASKPQKSGEVFAAYCVVELDGGTVKTEVLSHDEIEGIRKRSRAGNNGPWVTDWCEMAKKTAFRRATKWLPLSAEIREAFERDDDVIEGVAAPARPVASTLDDLSAMLMHDNSDVPSMARGEIPLDTPDEPSGEQPLTDESSPDQVLADALTAELAGVEAISDVESLKNSFLRQCQTEPDRAMVAGKCEARANEIRASRGARSNK